MLELIYGIYMFNMIYIANVACRYRVSLLVFNSRSYLFAAWNIKLNTRREIPYQLKILLVCCVIYWVEQLQRNSISVYVHVLFYMYLLTFFPYCVSYLGKYTHRTCKYFFIFYLFVLHLKWDILLTWFDSTVFSMVNSFLLTTDGLYSREDGNRWRFPSPWLGLPGRHTCIEIICSKYRQGKRRAKIPTSDTNPSTWYNSQKIQGSF